MKLEKRETDNFYTVEMDKAGEELLICYWCFDTLEEAQVFLNMLKLLFLAFLIFVGYIVFKAYLIYKQIEKNAKQNAEQMRNMSSQEKDISNVAVIIEEDENNKP